MRRRLPSLSALRAFEAAGRLQSFSRAADELSVSTGAISRQVRALEQALGRPLFDRLVRQVRLTVFGAAYLERISRGFDLIEAATADALGGERARLTIDAMPTTANLCLLPWLPSFTEAAGVEVHVVSAMAPVDFRTSPADVAIRVGIGPAQDRDAAADRGDGIGHIPHAMVTDWQGVVAEPLWDEVLVPVCSRAWFEARSGAGHPDAWRSDDLIHTVSRPEAWRDWYRAQGLAPPPTDGGVRVGHFYMALQMARRQRGVALVPTVHLNSLEWHGELQVPCPGVLRSRGGFYLLYRAGDRQSARIGLLRDWLRSRADVSAPAG